MPKARTMKNRKVTWMNENASNVNMPDGERHDRCCKRTREKPIPVVVPPSESPQQPRTTREKPEKHHDPDRPGLLQPGPATGCPGCSSSPHSDHPHW